MTQLNRGPGMRILLAVVLSLAAFALRIQAGNHLPVDFDEAIYLRDAQAYAQGIRPLNLATFFQDSSPENPPLMKLLFGLALATRPAQDAVGTDLNQPLPDDLLQTARLVSAAFGALGVLLLALVSPLAGLALAVHSLHIKYTAEVLLEALPFATSLLCVMAYQRSKGRALGWLIVSAIALGATAASKYLYCIAGLAVLVDWAVRIIRSPDRPQAVRAVRAVLIWGGVAMLAFLILNPHLWPDPVSRLVGSLTFHRENSSSAINAERYLVWQPLVWLAATPTFRPDVFLMRLDPVILILAALGVPSLWRMKRVYAIWLALGLVFLLAYSNRWPQYPLVILAPLCLSASLGLQALFQRPTWSWLRQHAPGLGLAVLATAWAVWLGQNWHQADPSFRDAMQRVQARIQPGEVALFASANPALEMAAFDPAEGAWQWSPTAALTRTQVTADYPLTSAWLNQALANRTGVWLLNYQGEVADPGDALKTLMQRQAHLLSPALTEAYPRGYALTHFMFDAPYQPTPLLSAFEQATIETGYGKPVGLASRGCAQLRPAHAGSMLEVMCQWQARPFVPLAWDTQVSLRLMDGQGNQVAQSDQMIARSGFPTKRFEGALTGNYFMPLPARLAPGPYVLRAFAYGSDGEYAPRVSADVVVSPPKP